MKTRKLFPENFAERVVVLFNYPQGTLSNLMSFCNGNLGSVKLVKMAVKTIIVILFSGYNSVEDMYIMFSNKYLDVLFKPQWERKGKSQIISF